jgi:hypothetical protein
MTDPIKSPQLSNQIQTEARLLISLCHRCGGWADMRQWIVWSSDMKPHVDAPSDGRGFSPVRRNDLVPASASGRSRSFPAQIHNGRRAAS